MLFNHALKKIESSVNILIQYVKNDEATFLVKSFNEFLFWYYRIITHQDRTMKYFMFFKFKVLLNLTIIVALYKILINTEK